MSTGKTDRHSPSTTLHLPLTVFHDPDFLLQLLTEREGSDGHQCDQDHAEYDLGLIIHQYYQDSEGCRGEVGDVAEDAGQAVLA